MSSVPSPGPFAYDFSIWYCPEDDAVASRISQRLRQEGFRGYAEHQDQVAGTSLILSTHQVLEASRVAILLFSAKSLGDPWCQRVCEWSLCHAVRRGGTRMIPVCLGVEEAEVPPFLQHLTKLHYHTDFFYDRLLASLRRACLAVSKARPAPASKGKS